MIELYNEDCLERLAKIKDKSVNLVLTDPPYNINKDKNWDKFKQKDYIEFMGKVFKESERVLADNGALYWFHNDMQQIAMLMEWIRQNTNLHFKSLNIWNKTKFKVFAWKNRNPEKCKDRNYFPNVEYCLYYVNGGGIRTQWDKTGLQLIQSNPNCYLPIKKYLLDEKEKIGLSTKELIDLTPEYLGRKVTTISHYFSDSQFSIPTKEIYENFFQKLGKEYEAFSKEYEDLRKEYEDLRKEYEKDRYVFNLGAISENISVIWESNETNSGKYHPCEKPIDLLEKIIKVSTNEENTVLDCFMGSGSTGVACKNTNRSFIGIERDEKYFNIAQERIKNA